MSGTNQIHVIFSLNLTEDGTYPPNEFRCTQ